MTELEKAEHDVQHAKRAANVADWKALEAKATYTRLVAASYEAEAELQAARIRLADAERHELAALSPAPSEGNALGEVEIPEGFAPHDGSQQPVDDFVRVAVVFRSGMKPSWQHPAGDWGHCWQHTGQADDIIAYRVLPSEPAAEAKGEDDAPVYGDDLAYGDGNDARIGNMPIECNPYEGKDAEYWNNGWTDADAIIQLNEPVPDTITIAASEQHAEESAALLANDQEYDPDVNFKDDGYAPVMGDEPAPLFPPEPPQPATPESLEATGVIDSEASWWARKLAKEPA